MLAGFAFGSNGGDGAPDRKGGDGGQDGAGGQADYIKGCFVGARARW